MMLRNVADAATWRNGVVDRAFEQLRLKCMNCSNDAGCLDCLDSMDDGV